MSDDIIQRLLDAIPHQSRDNGLPTILRQAKVMREAATEIERQREALRWYSDQRNYFPVERRSPGNPDPAVVFVDEPAIMTDWGRRARKALWGKP